LVIVKKPMRRAIAMIELIFAIIIMAIALMSAPMLVSQSSNSGYVGLQQEAITVAAAEIGMILTRPWDQNNTDVTSFIPILNTASGDSELNQGIGLDGNTTGRRVGTPRSSARSFFTALGREFNASAIGSDAGDSNNNDIDDFNGDSGSILVETETRDMDIGDYVDVNMTKNTTVNYISDSTDYSVQSVTFNFINNASATSTNIKRVNVVLTTANISQELNKTITLSAFTCNIGGYTELNEVRF